MEKSRTLPKITKHQDLGASRLFKIEEIHLEFSNGEQRVFERLKNRGFGSVMIVPMLNAKEVLLIREYAAGVERYELGLPKGLVEHEEDILVAANRELQEEVGYAANSLKALKTLTAAPGYLGSEMQVILAEDLMPSKLPGDEPEEIEVIAWSLENLDSLLAREDVTEARSIAALFLVRDYFANKGSSL